MKYEKKTQDSLQLHTLMITNKSTHSKMCPVTKHIIGHIGDLFYGSNDKTNSVKALKENSALKIGLKSHQVHPTAL